MAFRPTPGQLLGGLLVGVVVLFAVDRLMTHADTHRDTFATKRPVSVNDRCAYAAVPDGKLWWVTPAGATPPKYLVKALVPEVANGQMAGETWRQDILPLHPAECPRT